MITLLNHLHPWLFVGPFLLALAACPQKDPSGTTDDPEDATTIADAPTSSTTSGPPGTPTGETTAPSEPDTTSTPTPTTSTTSTSTSSGPDTTTTTLDSTTTTLDPGTTALDSATTLDPGSTGDACSVDLTISLTLDFDQCEETLGLIATVHNVGTSDAPAGIEVTYFEGTDASGLKLGSKNTNALLPAGGSTEVVWEVNVNSASDYYVEVDGGAGGGSIVECDENNNSALLTDAACPD